MRVLVKLKIHGSVTVFHIDSTIVVSKLTFILAFSSILAGVAVVEEVDGDE